MNESSIEDDEDLESYWIPIDSDEDLHSINQSLERVSNGNTAHFGPKEGFTVYEIDNNEFVYQAFENNDEMVLTGKESTLKDIVPGLDYISE